MSMQHYQDGVVMFNPTGFPVEVKASGREYRFEPFAELPIYHPEDREHIKIAFKQTGVVHLNYNEQARKAYKTEAEYKNDMELEGLKELLKYKEFVLNNEMQAEREMSQSKHSSSSDKRYLKTNKFKEEIKLINQWIKDAGGSTEVKKVDKTVVQKRPDWRGKEVKNDSSKSA